MEGDTHAKQIAGDGEVHPVYFLDIEVRYCIALLRLHHPAVVRSGG
jgi:hypothetical protein